MNLPNAASDEIVGSGIIQAAQMAEPKAVVPYTGMGALAYAGYIRDKLAQSQALTDDEVATAQRRGVLLLPRTPRIPAPAGPPPPPAPTLS